MHSKHFFFKASHRFVLNSIDIEFFVLVMVIVFSLEYFCTLMSLIGSNPTFALMATRNEWIRSLMLWWLAYVDWFPLVNCFQCETSIGNAEVCRTIYGLNSNDFIQWIVWKCNLSLSDIFEQRHPIKDLFVDKTLNAHVHAEHISRISPESIVISRFIRPLA